MGGGEAWGVVRPGERRTRTRTRTRTRRVVGGAVCVFFEAPRSYVCVCFKAPRTYTPVLGAFVSPLETR